MIRSKDFPENGSWVMITKEIPVGDDRVPPLSVWWAKAGRKVRRSECVSEYQFDGMLYDAPDPVLQYADILTPRGSLTLQPDEYTIVKGDDFLNEVGNGYDLFLIDGSEIHNFKQKLYYMRQRGLTSARAIDMVRHKNPFSLFLIAKIQYLHLYGFDFQSQPDSYYSNGLKKDFDSYLKSLSK